jgi:hypothetical protein
MVKRYFDKYLKYKGSIMNPVPKIIKEARIHFLKNRGLTLKEIKSLRLWKFPLEQIVTHTKDQLIKMGKKSKKEK